MRSLIQQPIVRRPNFRPRATLAVVLLSLFVAACGGRQPGGFGAPALVAFGPPQGVTVVADDGKLDISWDPQTQAKSFNLYWSLAPNPTVANSTKIPGLSTGYKHTGLTNDKEVYYLVTAVGPSGESRPTAFRAKPLKVSVLKFDQHIAVVAQPTDTFASLAQRFYEDRRKGWMIQDYNQIEALTPYRAVTVPLQPWKFGGLSASEYQTVPLLTYHRFSTDGTANQMTVPAANFEAQMKFLKDNDYNVVTLDEFVDFMELKNQLPERAVVITADDGWMSFYSTAYPILKKYGYPSTLFVYTDFPESTPQALTWAQIKEMGQNGVDIECHSKSHRNLVMKPGEDIKKYLVELEKEIRGVQDEMKRKGGQTCRYLAYPFGGRNPLVTALTQKYGFRAAFTVTRGSNAFFAQNYMVRRSMIYGSYSIKEFEKNLKLTAEVR
jgi:peptidoglycan/xylan/chitin deacetylase (PgdA/CDA1 family)